ncbi:glutathione S-transferase family protein [Pseudomonas chlororaphis]|uniref:glutathione S-transferase family protein n=1 Tax=Pseudomonas chlororaphis TaxID=587753 RepID=UPI0023675E5C|nr:glutathione S-transferase family protein [Pseudomonas chlororaphis]WDG77058.1 glutathione S-transferase family protein [Pseudomonas chlororaphis]WDG83702.1 glutathione S-transferase family protein [Pseudomonas chlororaphis]
MPLTLYFHPLSSFCHKVLIALYEHGIAFEKRIIDLANDADRAELQSLWPLGKFPVIRDHARQRDVPESSVIIEYLDRFYRGQRPLIPEDWDSALEVRLWDRFFDCHVQGPMQRIVADRLYGTHGDLSKERAALLSAYAMLERRLASRIWVASQDFSLADCAAAPALFYASTLVAFADEHRHLSAYFERLVQRPSFQRVIDEARPYFVHYPFAEAIPQRFR